ncbi:hypothetical protein J2T56_000955 [Natronobacillus azotifigens]
MGLFRYLFSKYKHEIFTTFDDATYYRIVNSLQTNDIPHQTNIRRGGGMSRSYVQEHRLNIHCMCKKKIK